MLNNGLNSLIFNPKSTAHAGVAVAKCQYAEPGKQDSIIGVHHQRSSRKLMQQAPDSGWSLQATDLQSQYALILQEGAIPFGMALSGLPFPLDAIVRATL